MKHSIHISIEDNANRFNVNSGNNKLKILRRLDGQQNDHRILLKFSKKKIPNIFDLIFEYLSYRYTEVFFLGD